MNSSKIWGQYLWRTLHSLNYLYPENIANNNQMKDLYKELYITLVNIIPCSVCKRHYNKKLQQNHITNNLHSKEVLIIWLNNIHNEVNRSLNKKVVTIKESNNIYFNQDKVKIFKYKDLIIFLRIISYKSNTNFFSLKKFIKLIFEINSYLIKYSPYSFNNIFKINNNEDLIKWTVEFDLEYCKNNDINPILELNSQKLIYYVDYSLRK